MKSDIINVNSDTSHVLIAHGSFSCCPLPGSLNRVLDFVQELYTLGNINKHVWSIVVWSETPDFGSVILLPLIIFIYHIRINEHLSSFLGFSLWTDFLFLDQV